LGTFQVRVGEQAIDDQAWRRRTARQLFKVLLTRPDRRMTRQEVIELFWPESDTGSAATNLRSTVHAIRRAFESAHAPEVVRGDHTSLWLDTDDVLWMDAVAFERKVTEAWRSPDPLPLLEDASKLYAGDYLPDDVFEDWAAGRRETLKRTWTELQYGLAQILETLPDPNAAIQPLERLLRADPCDERAAQELMNLLARHGQRSAAMRVFQRLSQSLRDELGVEPSPDTTELHHQIRSGESVAASPIPAATFRSTYPFPVPSELVGRQAELRMLSAMLADGRTAGRLALISAPAGTGKSALLGQMVRQAQAQGTLCLAGGCYEARGTVPLGPFHDALADFLLTQTPATLRSHMAAYLDDLAELVPELRYHLQMAVDPGTDRGAQNPMRTFGAVHAFLRGLAENGPVLLCIEDLHAADDATLQLVHYLARQTRRLPLVMVATFRDDEAPADQPLANTLAAMVRERLATSIKLSPLNQDDTQRLVGSLLDGPPSQSLGESLYEMTGGNPLFVEQLVLALEENGQFQRKGDIWRGITEPQRTPVVVREIIAQRLARLDASCRELLDAASVLGQAFEYRVVLALMEPRDEPSLLLDIDRAITAQVLQDTPGGYTFRHSLLRDALYSALTGPRRMLLHARTAEILERVYGPRADEHAAELAHHLALAGGSAALRAKQRHYSLIAARRADELSANPAPSEPRHQTGAAEAAANPWRLALPTLRNSPKDPGRPGPVPKGLRLGATLQANTELASMAWSPTGALLAVVSDESALLWDTGTWSPIRSLGGRDAIKPLAWSPDGKSLAVGNAQGAISVYDSGTGRVIHALDQPEPTLDDAYERVDGHGPRIPSAMDWSTNGPWLSIGLNGGTILIRDTRSWQLTVLEGHTSTVNALAWSPRNDVLASASSDGSIRLWNFAQGRTARQIQEHSAGVNCVAWSPDGEWVASASDDQSIRIYASTGILERVLQKHSSPVIAVASSGDGQFLASTSRDGELIIWRTDVWHPVASVTGPPLPVPTASIQFHPWQHLLATFAGDAGVHIWELDVSQFLAQSGPDAHHYCSAKVVLVGDTGVGKSGLGLVLSGAPFQPTDSTHGRHIWTFRRFEIPLPGGGTEQREVFLWDLAGQAGYRLVHQLHLHEVAAAVVVFDARNDVDPLAGVHYWSRALRQAESFPDATFPPMHKLLVAARTDRGPVAVSPARIDSLLADLGFDAYLQTSARDGTHIPELMKAIEDAIDWHLLPKVTSTDALRKITVQLIREKASGRPLSSVDDLWRRYVQAFTSGTHDMSEFRALLGQLAAQGLLRRLSFGDLILLHPELIDAYASAIVNAATADTHGLGSISEEVVLRVQFPMPADERLVEPEQERLLVLATVEDMLLRELALRDYAEDGPQLVFPSHLTREFTELTALPGHAVTYHFEGAIANIYATLVVRLSHSGFFQRRDLWKGAATFVAKLGGGCGFFVQHLDEGRAELSLFFEQDATEETRYYFDTYVETHLKRRAVADTVRRSRVFACSNQQCLTPISDLQAQRRIADGWDWIRCNVCDTRISLLDREARARSASHVINEIDRSANSVRRQEAAVSVLEGKLATADFDVFLAHRGSDSQLAEELAMEVRKRGLNPWLDSEQIAPGRWFQDVIQQAVPRVKSVAVLIGQSGLGPWELVELRTFVSRCVDEQLPVIPVLLPEVEAVPESLVFLKELNWVRFYQTMHEPASLDRLVWGITGRRIAGADGN
jgi:WD40 repeat protein/DNA-binding SARP family transcriptional activator